jgi:pimeloyl-ACP methyl ester carboxylesterase
MLETIDKGHCTAEHPSPLLFVHGAWHGAWCWDEHFLDFFADRGYRAVAVNLPAHGGRTRTKPLHRHSFDDYIHAIASAAEHLPSPPILVGHSMGGFLLQKYLESRHSPAAVLVASMPPQGPIPFLKRWRRQHPARFAQAMLTRNTLHLLDTPQLVRNKFFSPSTPEADVRRCTELLQNESTGTSWGMIHARPKPERVLAPVLVLGAELDGCFPVTEVHDTARAYGTEAVMFPNMGHDMMLEPGWRDVASLIDGWLIGQGL